MWILSADSALFGGVLQAAYNFSKNEWKKNEKKKKPTKNYDAIPVYHTLINIIIFNVRNKCQDELERVTDNNQ